MLLNEQTAVQLGDKKVVGVRQGDKFILGRHNLVPNGRAKYTSGTVEVRRNLALNPRQASGGSSAEIMARWSWTASRISNFSGLHGVTTAARMTSPSSETTGGSRGFDFYANMDIAAGTSGAAISQPVTPGKTIHLECSFAMSFSGGAYMESRFHDGNGNWVSASVKGAPATPSGIGVVTNASIDVVVPAGAAYLAARLGTIGSITFPANATMDMSELYIGAPGDYFDGSYSPDPDLTPSWTGTANESTSVLTGVVPTTVMGMHDRSINVQSQAWPIGGTSIRVIPRTANNDCFAEPGGGGGGVRLGLVTGKPVAIKAVGHLFKIQQGTLSSAARRVAIGLKVDGVYSFVLGSQMPNEIGDFSSELSMTIPETVTDAFIRLYNGASAGNGDVYWTDIRVCQADTEEEALRLVRAPYRDGDSPGWTWDGTPGQSASRGLS